jgi:hypothetical protein
MDKITIFHGSAENCSSWNRTLCTVLEEMRKCYETRKFAPLPGLIEEAQIYGNRMEAKLADVHDYARLKRKYKALRKKLDATSENAEDSAII